MNAKRLGLLSCVVALALPISVATGQPRGGARAHVGSMPARSAPTLTRSAPSGTFGNWSGQNWSGDWRHHRFSSDRFIFIDTFGFPFFYGYPYYSYYPYDYYGYGYGYPYGYYSSYGYDYDYYSQPAYDYGYSGGYGDRSSVVELQRRLARAGYYHGAIDGIMGPATRRALRAYERTHNQRGYGMTDRY